MKRYCKFCRNQLKFYQKLTCSLICRGKQSSIYNKKNKILPPYMKGFKWTEKQKSKLREIRALYPSSMKRPEVVAKVMLAKKHTYDLRGRKSCERDLIKNSEQYKNWRRNVFVRDKYTCQICGVVGGSLCVDHIKPFSLFPDRRFDILNGRTLCKECHKNTPTYGNRLWTYKKELGRDILLP